MDRLLFSLAIAIGMITSNLSFAAGPSVGIKPHRAFYTVSLKSAKDNSEVVDTQGKMVLELTHDCSGWTLKQDSASIVALKASPDELMRSSYLAWESNDGKTLRFQTQRIYNDAIEDTIGGIAGFTDNGGDITYSTPEVMKVKMQAGTLPPIAHLQKLIATAQSGEGTSTVQVFDGSFYGNPVQIDAFIGPKKEGCSNLVRDKTVWPMNLAVYPMPSNSATPSFEMEQKVTNEGVMCYYSINFGDYAIKGKLDKVEYLPEKSCKAKR